MSKLQTGWGGLNYHIVRRLKKAGFNGLSDLAGTEALALQNRLKAVSRRKEFSIHNETELLRIVEFIDDILQRDGLKGLIWHTVENIRSGAVQTPIYPTFRRKIGVGIRWGKPVEDFSSEELQALERLDFNDK